MGAQVPRSPNPKKVRIQNSILAQPLTFEPSHNGSDLSDKSKHLLGEMTIWSPMTKSLTTLILSTTDFLVATIGAVKRVNGLLFHPYIPE